MAEGSDWLTNINSKSLERLAFCRVEPHLADAKPGERFQFERLDILNVNTEDFIS